MTTTFLAMASSTTLEVPHSRPRINGDLHEVAHEVHQEFDEKLDPQAVDECLARVSDLFTDAQIRALVPLLVRRYVNDELQERIERG
jgi:hypothetical protein